MDPNQSAESVLPGLDSQTGGTHTASLFGLGRPTRGPSLIVYTFIDLYFLTLYFVTTHVALSEARRGVARRGHVMSSHHIM